MRLKNSEGSPVARAWMFWRAKALERVCLEMGDIVHTAPEMTHIEQMVFFALKGMENGLWSYGGVKISPQQQIGKYRVDFLVEGVRNMGPIVIECDGHDFHERTKDQAQRDKQRDRELQAKGYKVFRFTGSEIHRTSGGCVLQSLGMGSQGCIDEMLSDPAVMELLSEAY